VKAEADFLAQNGIGHPWRANALDGEARKNANDMLSYLVLAVLPVVEHFEQARPDPVARRGRGRLHQMYRVVIRFVDG
jgi:hypothetical protein